MCDVLSGSPRGVAATPRPRWGQLYGIALLGVLALAVADVAAPTTARSTLDGVLAGAAFAAIALWVRGNRTALDFQDWCECAADQVTMRLITSMRPERCPPIVPAPEQRRPPEELEEAFLVGSSR